MLVPCVECGREISDSAVACPNCGAPTGTENEQLSTERHAKKEFSRSMFLAAITLAVVAFLAFTVRQSGTSLPSCESARAERDVRDLTANSKTTKFDIVIFGNPKTISNTAERVECEAKVVLSNTVEATLLYEFFVEDGEVFVKTSFHKDK